jgi:hypothetical protein
MTSQPLIIADFEADWLEHMANKLTAKGFKVKAGIQADELSRMNWNVIFRHVPVQPRTVVRAAEFVCPPEHGAGLAGLAGRFEQGEDVNPWLSTKYRRGQFNDKLLNDWGIHHFHLGLTPEERHDHCLFAKVVLDAVFFVHILPHDRYTDRDLLRRIHLNWPRLLERFRVVGVTGPDLDDEEVQAIRDKNGNVALLMPDGVTYFPPGGGLMSTGLSSRVRMNADFAIDTIREHQARIEADIDSIAEQFRQQGRPITPPAVFTLLVEDAHELWAMEVNCKARFQLGPLFPPASTAPSIEITG